MPAYRFRGAPPGLIRRYLALSRRLRERLGYCHLPAALGCSLAPAVHVGGVGAGWWLVQSAGQIGLEMLSPGLWLGEKIVRGCCAVVSKSKTVIALVDELLGEADANNDGQISYEEFLALYRTKQLSAGREEVLKESGQGSCQGKTCC